MPISPSSPSCLTIAYGNDFVRSSSSATGATSPSAKSRTVRRISSWSSGRSKFMPYLYRTLVTNASLVPALREKYDRRQQEVVDDRRRAVRAPRLPGHDMDELSEATGLRSGGLYHYIGSKQRLLFQIFEQLMDPLLERAAEIESGDDDAGGEAARARPRLGGAHRAPPRPHGRLRPGAPRDRARARVGGRARSRDRFEAILARRLAAVGLTDRLALFALLGMVNHTATWLKPGGRLTAEQIADGYCDMLLQ